MNEARYGGKNNREKNSFGKTSKYDLIPYHCRKCGYKVFNLALFVKHKKKHKD